ncbi:MAG: DUF1700 domain-containing protein [Clostridia bacterium]|nr:DUF1700 domain-containing protein [Clostridia bacterium]MBR2327920.1 DUF1700 domain-containing protein [Clostridia bacterium]
MTKIEFLLALSERLSGLPKEEKLERLNFYSEMIEDRIEEGLSEEEAVAAVGTLDELSECEAPEHTEIIPEENPEEKTEQDAPKKEKKLWLTVLIACSFPIWLPVLIAVLAVALSVYVVLWALIISLWAVFGAAAVTAITVIIIGIVLAAAGRGVAGAATVGIGIFAVGLSLLFFVGCRAATKGTAFLTTAAAKGVKRIFNKKEEEI